MHEETPSAKPRMPLWGRVALFLVCYSVAAIAAQVWFIFATTDMLGRGTFAPSSERQPPGLSLGWTSAIALSSVALSYCFWVWIDRRRWSEIRFKLADGAAWRRGVLIALLLIGPGVGIPVLTGHLHFEGWAFSGPAEGFTRICLHAGAALAAAVAVELPFRGYLLGTLGEAMPVSRRVWISVLLYWLGHAWMADQRDILNILVTVLSGAALAYLRLASGSLALPTAVAAMFSLEVLLFSTDPWMEPLATVRFGKANLWLGSEYQAGLLDVWLGLFWLVGIYAWVYLPSGAHPEGGGSSGALDMVPSDRPREPDPAVERKPAEEGGVHEGGAPQTRG